MFIVTCLDYWRDSLNHGNREYVMLNSYHFLVSRTQI